MEFIWRRSKMFIVMALLLTVVGVALAAVRPRPVAIPVLGTEWQCSRTLFVFTSCFHSSSHAPAPNERNGASILRAMPQYSSRTW